VIHLVGVSRSRTVFKWVAAVCIQGPRVGQLFFVIEFVALCTFGPVLPVSNELHGWGVSIPLNAEACAI
jgi:hypothetical protein